MMGDWSEWAPIGKAPKRGPHCGARSVATRLLAHGVDNELEDNGVNRNEAPLLALVTTKRKQWQVARNGCRGELQSG